MWFCTYCHLCSIKMLRMMLRVVSLYVFRRKRDPHFLFLACWAKMSVNKQMMSGTFTCLREEHCWSWLRETSLGLFPNIWTKTRARSAALKNERWQSKCVTHRDFLLYLGILIGEAELVWAFLLLLPLLLVNLQMQFERQRVATLSQLFYGFCRCTVSRVFWLFHVSL